MVSSMEVAFGSSKPRFGNPCMHYKLDPLGIYTTKSDGCDPALYHPKPVSQVYASIRKRNVTKDPWRFEVELTDWCKNLGYRNQAVLQERRFNASLGGPAWTSQPDPVKYEPACKNVLFGRTPRFKSPRIAFPGPGTYFRSVPYKAPYGPHSTRPTLNREEPCRFPDRVPRWSLAPNRYVIWDPDSIENKPKKIVSLIGPYSLFTGKRFSAPKKVFSKSWPLMLPGCFEGLKQKHTGEWNKTGRDKPPRHRVAMSDLASCPRQASEPSAPTYFPNLYDIKKPPQNKHGFNSSYDKPPLYQRVIVYPGVGRYKLNKERQCGILGQGHRHVFLCKVPRTMGAHLPEKMNTF